MTTLGIRFAVILALGPGIPPDNLDAHDEARAARPALREGPPLSLLRAWLQGDDTEERVMAARELGRMGAEARDAIPALVEASRHVNERTRVAAVEALCRLDAPAATARIRELIEAIGKRDSTWGELGMLGDVAVPQYLELVLEPKCQATALSLLEKHRGKAIPRLVRGLDHRDARVRASAALGLSRAGAEWTKPAQPRLLRALDDDDAAVRLHAAWAVWQLEQKAERVVPRLAAALRSSEKALRAEAVNYLYRMEALAADAAPALVEALGDDSEEIVRPAARTLAAIGSPAVPDLILGLREGNKWRRRKALVLLRELGPKPEVVCPALLPLLKDPDPPLRVDAARLLARLDPGRRSIAVSALIGAMTDREASYPAMQTLASLGSDARAAVPALLTQLEDPDREFALASARALAAIDPQSAPAALPVVHEGLASSKSSVRGSALACLGQMGPAGRDAVPSVLALLKLSLDDSRRNDPEDVMQALVKLGGGPSALPLLLDAFMRTRPGPGRGGPGRGDRFSGYPVTACFLLLREDAIPALMSLSMSGDRRATRTAGTLLRRINQSTP